MKVLMLNGSPRTKGNTFIALEEMKKVFEVEGVEAEIVQVGNKDVRGCIACRRCVELGKCVFDEQIIAFICFCNAVIIRINICDQAVLDRICQFFSILRLTKIKYLCTADFRRRIAVLVQADRKDGGCLRDDFTAVLHIFRFFVGVSLRIKTDVRVAC